MRTDHSPDCIRGKINTPVYVEYEYEVYVDAEGTTKKMKGIWILNDGGYHQWLHTIAGPKAECAPTLDEERWGGRCESIRKDAEPALQLERQQHQLREPVASRQQRSEP